MRGITRLVTLLMGLGIAMGIARADVLVRISKGAQMMDVYVDGDHTYSWPVSTGRSGYTTPSGRFRAQRFERVYYSRKYDNAPMPNAIFFYGGYAIHGSYEIRNLGRPASHGCVRLHPRNAAELYQIAQEYGPTRVAID